MENSRKNLWGEQIQILRDREETARLINKVANPKTTKDVNKKLIESDKIPLNIKLDIIKKEVFNKLGIYKDKVALITTKEQFESYINIILKNNIVSIDTETYSFLKKKKAALDPLTCKLTGCCLYTPGEKAVYIPINHLDLNNNRLQNQLTEDDLFNGLNKIYNCTIIMHNGKFDYQVLKCTCNLVMPITHDTMIAAQVLNENESAALKFQYKDKVDDSVEDYDYSTLFGSIINAYIPPEIFLLYAAPDALITYKLYEWQLKEFNKLENYKLYNSLFKKVEMPDIIPVAETELRGVSIDLDLAKRLSTKFHKKLNTVEQQLNTELNKYSDRIKEWRLSFDATNKTPKIDSETGLQKVNKKGELLYNKSKAEQLEDPVKLSSPQQLAILLYDIIGVESIDGQRSTDKKILAQLDLPLCKLITKYNNYKHLLDSFIDTLPTMLNEKDGLLHASFNQLGREDNNVVTGRFSSTEPNLQQIPSRGEGNSIRMMFTPTRKDFTLVGADFSSQEIKILAQLSQDKKMIQTFKEGKNLYSAVASMVYHNNYEDNLEFNPDGTMNPEGKHRRQASKSVILGLIYGRGLKSIAEQIKKDPLADVTKEDINEAKYVTNTFYESYPDAATWFDATKEQAHKYGYVEDIWGRRRRVIDAMLPKYSFTLKNPKQSTFNPLFGSTSFDYSVSRDLQEKYIKLFENCRSANDRIKIEKQALTEGIIAKDNTSLIAKAERQAINARIQGSAASMTKLAISLIYNDPVMKELDFHTLIFVHDELIGECPKENAEAAKKRLSELMSESAKPECDLIDMTCDADDFNAWYEDVLTAEIKEDYENYINGNKEKDILPMPNDLAFKQICLEHSEFTEEQLHNMLGE